MVIDDSRPVWVNRPVFVTGATGLLGSALVRRLVEARSQVVCLVRDHVPGAEFHSSGLSDAVSVVRGDVTDQSLLERIIGEYEVATVMHLAAQTIVGVANRNPVSTFESNIRGTWALLEASRRCPTIEQVVVASSDKAYGDQLVLPYEEDTPLQGRNPYDVSKSCADLIAYSYFHTYSLPVVVTRCGNLFGGGDLNWNRLIPGTIRAALQGEAPVIRSDGTYIRDYLYVEDGAEAYLALAEALMRQPSFAGEAFNFSYEQPMSVIAVVQMILRLMGSELVPEVRAAAKNEIAHQHLSSTKARRELNWKPAIGLEEGLLRTIAWYENRIGRVT